MMEEPIPFRNRREELAMLDRRWREGRGQVFVLWGRRRVGKSLLLLEFARGKRHLYFEATSGTRADQLADFSERLAEATGRTELSVPSWRAALDAVADWAQDLRRPVRQRGRLLRARGRRLLRDDVWAARRVLPQLDAFISKPAVEEVCQQWLRTEVDAAGVGWWWGRVRELRTGALRDVDRELDVVAIDDDGAVIAIGSCKWTDEPIDTDELAKLDALALHLADGRERPARYCFSRGGFTRQLRAAARADPGVRLVTPKQLFTT